MQDISNTIYRYYAEHFEEMPFDQQFHFASRLHLWSRVPEATEWLQRLKPEFTAHDKPADALKAVIQAAQAAPNFGSKNAANLRMPYFQKYPQLKPYVSGLFRTMWLKHVYGFDVRSTFYECFPRADIESFAAELLADPAAVAMLSTHAINFLYLYSRIVAQDTSLFDPAQFLKIASEQYNLEEPTELQLFIYLYTHCIIGESLFYYRQPAGMVYEQMLNELGSIIDERFQMINLDNKFEFLVCARLLRKTSQLESRIFEEASRSLSSEGSFLVDTHNNNPQAANVDLASSEHRNVLFILASQPFQPLGSPASL